VLAKDLIEAHAHYAAAVVYEQRGEMEQAQEEYYQAATKDPGNERLLLEATRRLLQFKQPEKALDILLIATARPEASGILFAQLGFVYSTLGKPDLAIQANRTAIQRQPRSLIGYQNLYVNHFQSQRWTEAMASLDEAARVTGVDAEFLIGVAELYANYGFQIPSQKQDAFAKALPLLERAEQMNVTEPSLRLRLADGFNLLGKEDKAAVLYADLLKHPLDIPYVREDIRAKLTDIYLRERNRTNAIEQLEAAVRDNPTDSQAYYLLGIIAYEDRQYGRAADFLTKTLLLRPDAQAVHYDLASAHIRNNDPDSALDILNQARQKFAQNFDLEFLSGMAYAQREDYTNAARCFSAAEIIALAGEPNRLNHLFYFQYGAACERQGEFVQAEKYFEKCLQLAPDSDEALNYLGYIWAERGEKLDRARELIEKALKMDPDNAAYLDSMGWVLFKLQQPKEALEYLLKAVELSEEPDAVMYDHLGDVYGALGEKGKAVEAWRKSLAIEANDQIQRKLEADTLP
jgi:tetratricopeptide (TPR) repeat protein